LLQYESSTGLWKNKDQSTLVIAESQVTNLVTDLASKASLTYPVNAQTGTTYTLAATDPLYFIELNNASAITITVPTDASVTIPVGSSITMLQTGAGQVSIVAASGVTLNYTPGNKLRAQWSSATLYKRSANTWVLFGDTVA